ncbi:hypothetical protein D3C81_1701020 [compost metagenome]
MKIGDCNNRSGTIYTTDMADKYKFDNDFAFGAGNIASGLAESICSIAFTAAQQFGKEVKPAKKSPKGTGV